MTETETTISQVTVYPDRARVLRRGKTELQHGPHSLVISDLPHGLDPDSVRAAGRGQAQVRILGVSVERVHFRETPAERARELETEIQNLEDEDAARESESEAVQSQLAHLEELAGQTEIFAKGLAFGRTQVSDQAELLDYVRAQGSILRSELQTIKVERRETAKTLKKLRQELQRLSGARPRRRFVAKIDVEVTEPGQFEADLTYTLGNASWRPLYDVRFWEATAESQEPKLEMTYLAQVQQKTGEDWTNVELVLSTARPAVTGTLPELDPWYLRVRPLPVPKGRPLAQALQAPAAAPVRAKMAARVVPEAGAVAVAEPYQAEVSTATVDTTGAAVTFRVGALASIPSDGEPHKVTVASYWLEPKLDYVTAPKLAEVAHRRARVTNATEAVFLPGQANVFAGEEFVGPTELELVAPNEQFELALGVDDRIKVKREMVARQVDKTIIRDKRRLSFGYQIEVENLRPVPETVIVRDHYPLPRHEQVKVRLESAHPKPTEATEMNLLEWDLTLEPGQKEEIRFDVQIEHPRIMIVDGLPD